MDKKLKTKWVKALRSGKYQQGKGCLKNNNGEFCCLGVLCDIQGYSWAHRRTSLATSDMPRDYNAGLKKDERVELAIKNDKWISFNDIADHIEFSL